MAAASDRTGSSSPAGGPDREQLLDEITGAADILALATALLRRCRAGLEALIEVDADPAFWSAREALRRRAEALFAAVDDELIDPDERAALADLARGPLAGGRARTGLPPVLVARVIAEALDAALGDRFLPMFLNRSTVLGDGDPIPTPHPDWRELSPSPNSDPWALDGRLDALPHLRLADALTRQVRVTVDGNWRTWHAVPQLGPGDRLACAVPNRSLAEFTWTRDTVAGRPVFYDFRLIGSEADQIETCLSLLERAAGERCRVVVFPELCAPKPVVDAMARWLDRQRQVELVIAGSRHRRAARGRWHNQTQLLFRGARRRRRHHKFRPFSFLDSGDGERVRRYEHLAASRPKLVAWLSPRFTMVTPICKDLVQEPMPRLLDELRANLVLVPALTFKTDAFHAAVAEVAARCQAITLVANACLATGARGQRRADVTLGVPAQRGSVHAVTPKAPALVVVTLGSKSRRARIYSA